MKKAAYFAAMAYQLLLTFAVFIQSHGYAFHKVRANGKYHTELVHILPLLAVGAALVLALEIAAVFLDGEGRFVKLLVPVFLLLGTGIVFQCICHEQTALRHIVRICIALAFGGVCFFCSALAVSRRTFRNLLWAVIALSILAVLTAVLFRRDRTGGTWGELAKLLSIYLCAMAFPHIRELRQRRLFFITLAALLVSVVMMKDYGTAIVLLAITLCAMLYVSPALAVLTGLGAALLGGGGVLLLRLFSPGSYILQRIDACGKVLLNNEANENFRQQLLSLVRGGMLGMDASGTDAWYSIYAAASQHDFVFLSLTATLGIGIGLVVLLCYAAIGLECCDRRKARTNKRALTVNVTGFALAFQAAISILGQLNLIPLTGITCPFLAYGGSSLLASSGMVGVALAARLSAPELGSIQFYWDCILDRLPGLPEHVQTRFRKAAHKQ